MAIDRGAPATHRLPPAHPGIPAARLTLVVLVALAVVTSFPFSQVVPLALVAPENATAVARFLGGLFPPELAPRYLRRIGQLMAETIAISIAGTVLALLAAVPLSLAALRQRGEETAPGALGRWHWAGRWLVYGAARAILNLGRAVPELVWALIFVVMVGLGPFPGVLALAAHSAGILGKLYAEVLETADQRAVEAVRATGATEGQVTALARVPLALPVLVSYTLFRWECNLRSATVLGLVGAGGIGAELVLSFKLFRYHELLTQIIAILILVTLVDLIGQVLRARLLDGSAPHTATCTPGEGRRPPLAVLRDYLSGAEK